MGREVRMVPENWEHPTEDDGSYIPLFNGKDYIENYNRWILHNKKWNEGLRDDYNGGWKPLDGAEGCKTYSEWNGGKPRKAEYMPVFLKSEATHFMMYETTTEGTPISPAFKSPGELANWLYENNASANGNSQQANEQ